MNAHEDIIYKMLYIILDKKKKHILTWRSSLNSFLKKGGSIQ